MTLERVGDHADREIEADTLSCYLPENGPTDNVPTGAVYYNTRNLLRTPLQRSGIDFTLYIMLLQAALRARLSTCTTPPVHIAGWQHLDRLVTVNLSALMLHEIGLAAVLVEGALN